MGQRTLDIDLASGDWQWMAVHGGAVRICLPATWTRVYRDDGGLALQSPVLWAATDGRPVGGHPLDLLVSVTTYANEYGVDAEDALQYLDRDHLLPPGVTAMASGDRRWIAYCAALPAPPQPGQTPEQAAAVTAALGAGARVPEAQIFVWKMADFRPPDRVRVATLQLYVPGEEFWVPGLGALLDRLGDEIGRMEFGPADQGPVSAVTMRNIVHADVLRFRLPWDWRSSDEDEDDLGGPETSHFRRPDDAEADEILRVVVHDYPPPDDMEPESALESALAAGLDWEAITSEEGDGLPPAVLLQRIAAQFADGPDGQVGMGSVDTLADDEVLARFTHTAVEDGRRRRCHLWLRGAVVGGRATLAVFSYGLPEGLQGSPLAVDAVAMLEREIRRAQIGGYESLPVGDASGNGDDGLPSGMAPDWPAGGWNAGSWDEGDALLDDEDDFDEDGDGPLDSDEEDDGYRRRKGDDPAKN
ncbi:hypothetical protein [Nitrospirillum bahiense]|uniref:Uncharacterized protein n=1 Tax=Nitrospirillum amazonense TaxID=28077 RepID=A0A560FB90_9PROT|nr:hypothetical protein [Nitrospirillum amazonense]TWB18877.1 hypothetical protein FBZ88_12333 [Nitrospirillum amazonense]